MPEPVNLIDALARALAKVDPKAVRYCEMCDKVGVSQADRVQSLWSANGKGRTMSKNPHAVALGRTRSGALIEL